MAATEAGSAAEARAVAGGPPFSLREARALADRACLKVTVSRVAGRVFVSLHEPGCASAPAACFEPGSGTVFAGLRTVAPEAAKAWLTRYRMTVTAWREAYQRCGGGFADGLFSRDGGELDRRIAHLVPRLVTGPDYASAVARAAGNLGGPSADETEASLREAERAAGPLVLSPAREAAFTARIRAGARKWHELTGDPARYIGGREAIQAPDALRATPREEDWIRRWIRDHDQVLTGPPEETPGEDPAVLRTASRQLQKEAKAAFDSGDTGRALLLADGAELADPAEGTRLARIRGIITGGSGSG